jgi:hypothetical protein
MLKEVIKVRNMTTHPATEDDYMNKEINQWACKYLSSHGYTLKNNLPEKVQNTPWSCVVRFASSQGYIYLKYTPKLLALESTIIQVLHDQFHACVPEVIAHNTELNFFLMKDAGRPLRIILKEQFNVAALCKAIDKFTSLQLAVADHVDIFLDMGVPDWRLNKLPELYKEVILQKDLLLADGLSETELGGLEGLVPRITNSCKNLSGYNIKQTIVQPDFNDNNMLIYDFSLDITLIDLGEISISHPFFSLLNCLHQIKKHHALTDTDEAYLKIKEACFINYMNFESKDHFLNAFATAQILWLVYGIVSQYRLMMACGIEKIISFQPGNSAVH